MAKTPESGSSSEPFVSQQDRPNIHADTPVSELRVRDLQTLLGSGAVKIIEVVKHPQFEKLVLPDLQTKVIKDIHDYQSKPVVEAPTGPWQGDPVNQIMQSVTGLQNAVNQLTNEVAQLKAKAAKG